MRSAAGVAILVAMVTPVAGAPPQKALTALQRAYSEYSVGGMKHLIKADVDGDGREDWIGLATKDDGDWAVLIAYHREDGWRAGNIDMGVAALSPLELELLPPGRYERHPSCVGELAVNERAAFSSALPGVVATGFGGQRRAYQLGHAWGFVCLGAMSERSGT